MTNNSSKICMVTCTMPMEDNMVSVWNELSRSLSAFGYRLVMFTTSYHPDIAFDYVIIPFTLDEFADLETGNDLFLFSENYTALVMAEREIAWFRKDKKLWSKHVTGYSNCKDFYLSVLNTLHPSVVFAWQNSLPQTNILKRLCSELSVPCYILERGMFPDTFMIEREGNCSLSDLQNNFSLRKLIASDSRQEDFGKIKEYYLTKMPVKYTQMSYEMSQAEFSSFKLPYEKLLVYFTNVDSSVGMYPDDTNLALKTSPHFQNTLDTIDALTELSKKQKFNLVVKLHPHDTYDYSSFENGHIKFLKNFSYQFLMNQADVMVFTETTLQFEALLYEKPLVLLTISELNGYNIAYQISSDTPLDKTVEDAINKRDFYIKNNNAKKFIHWTSNYFLFGYNTALPVRHSIKDWAEFASSVGICYKEYDYFMNLSALSSYLKRINYPKDYSGSGVYKQSIHEVSEIFFYFNTDYLRGVFRNFAADTSYNIKAICESAKILTILNEYDLALKYFLRLNQLSELSFDQIKWFKLLNDNNSKQHLNFSGNVLTKYLNFGPDDLANNQIFLANIDSVKRFREAIEHSNYIMAENLISSFQSQYNKFMKSVISYEIEQCSLFNAMWLLSVLQKDISQRSYLNELEEALLKKREQIIKKTGWNEKLRNELFSSAENMIMKNELQNAKVLLKRIASLEPDNVNAWNNLAVISIYEKDIHYAHSLLRKALEISPSNKIARENITYVEEELGFEDNGSKITELLAEIESLIQDGLLAEARLKINLVLELNMDNPEALNSLTLIEIIENNLDAAITLISGIINKDPSNSQALSHLKYLKEQVQQTRNDKSKLLSYNEKYEQEIKTYENQEIVHNLPESHHIFTGKFVSPNLQKYTGCNTFQDWCAAEIDKMIETLGRKIYGISVGCGNGDLEIEVLKKVKNKHLIQFGGIDINPAMLKRGKEQAELNGLNMFDFRLGDFNYLNLDRKYDFFFANHSLHHVVQLENLFDTINHFSTDDMIFMINDMIGRNGHVLWDSTKIIIDQIWKYLSPKYKLNAYTKKIDHSIMNHDCSSEGFEGIRAQDILPLLVQRFDLDMYFPFGTIINRFVDRAYGHNFDTKNPADVKLLMDILEFDIELLQGGILSPTQAFIKAKKKGTVEHPAHLFQTPQQSIKAREYNIGVTDYLSRIELLMEK